MYTRNVAFFLLSMVLFQLSAASDNELDVRFDAQANHFQEEHERAKEKLEQEKIKTRQFLSELRLLAAGESTYEKELSEVVSQAMQPLAELVGEETVKLAAYITASGMLQSSPSWYWANAQGTTGLKSGYGSTDAAARSNALAVSDGVSFPAQLTTTVTTYNGSYGNYYNGSYFVRTASSTISVTDANNKAKATWDAAFPTVTNFSGSYSDYWNGVFYTQAASSTISRADADAKARAAWFAIYKTYTGSCNGYSSTSIVSQSDADLKAKMAWLDAKVPTGEIISLLVSDWRPVSTPVPGNIKLTFTAAALSDLFLLFLASDGTYFYLALGGWSNTVSVIRCFSATKVQQGADIFPSGQNQTIPDTVNPVAYTLTIMNGQLTLSSLVGGVTSTRIVYSDSILLSKTFTAYSFGTATTTVPWKVTNVICSASAYTGTYNGCSAISTASQIDADAKARAAWAAVETTVLTPAYNAYCGALSGYQTALDTAKTMANELIDLFKADPVSSYSVASWAKV